LNSPGGGRGRRPPWASGVLAGSYEPLFAYWEEARRRGREDLVESAMLGEADFDLLRRLASRGPSTALDLLEELERVFEGRLDEDVARAAAARLGIDAGPGEARRLIARLLASWLLEAGDYWRIIRLRGPRGSSALVGEE